MLGVFRVPVDREGIGIDDLVYGAVAASVVDGEAPGELFALNGEVNVFSAVSQRGVGCAADHELVDAGLVARAVVFNAIVVIDVFPEFRPGLWKDLPLFHRDRGDAGVDSASFRIADDADANGAGNEALLFEHFHIAGRFDEAVDGRLDHRDHFFGLDTAIHADAFFQSVDAQQRLLDGLPLELVRRAVAQVIIASREDAPDVVAFL